MTIDRRRRRVEAVAALVVTAVACGAGFWQLERARGKEARAALLDERAALVPLGPEALARQAGDASAQWQRPARLRGRWLAEYTVYLDNRPWRGGAGFVAVTPLALADGSAILVQRGWIARDLRRRTHIADAPLLAGEVEVVGRVAPAPGRVVEFSSRPEGRIRQNLDLVAYARETGLALRPVTLLQTDGTTGDALRRDWPQPAIDAPRHRGYAFQWFGLGALVAGLYVGVRIHGRARRRAVA